MRWPFLILPLTIVSGDVSKSYDIYEAGYAQDRCCNSGCLAEVTTSKADLVVTNITTNNVLSVYFEEDSDSLTRDSIAEINEFLSNNPNMSDITVIGNTDGCGQPTYNVGLSGRRASKVRNQILRSRNASVTSRWNGEIVSGHSPTARRVDIVATSHVTLSGPPPRIIADFYLLDASGSMAGGDWQRYVRSISYHRPRGSRVFISTTNCIRRRSNLSYLNPAGPTEIWYSYWTILDKMSPGQTLVIISDFDSRISLTQAERQMLAEKVREKNVTVRTIRL